MAPERIERHEAGRASGVVVRTHHAAEAGGGAVGHRACVRLALGEERHAYAPAAAVRQPHALAEIEERGGVEARAQAGPPATGYIAPPVTGYIPPPPLPGYGVGAPVYGPGGVLVPRRDRTKIGRGTPSTQ